MKTEITISEGGINIKRIGGEMMITLLSENIKNSERIIKLKEC
jgi:hypothetical protein